MQIDPTTLIRVLRGEASTQEMRQVEAWRSRSPSNEEEYRRLERLWNVSGDLDLEFAASPPAAHEIIEVASKTALENPPDSRDQSIGDAATTEGGSERRGPDRRRRAWMTGSIAAALVVGIGLGTWVARNDRGAPEPEVVDTGANDVATVTLRDQTVVRLAPQSRLEFSRDDDVREVSLTGRAFLAVAEDSERPFRVRLPTGEVEVLGTRFDVESRDDAVQVTVVEGNVRMQAQGAQLNVGASQVARVSSTGVPEVENVEDVYEIINWLGQFLAFESTPMEKIAVELERRFDIRIEIVDPVLRERTVTGWFADQSPESMITGICTVVEARCSVENGVVRMESARTGPPGSRDALRPTARELPPRGGKTAFATPSTISVKSGQVGSLAARIHR